VSVQYNKPIHIHVKMVRNFGEIDDGNSPPESPVGSQTNLLNPEDRIRIEENMYQQHAADDDTQVETINDRDVLVQVEKPKNYGTLSSQIVISEKLDYMWKNIDVFGEASPVDLPQSRKLMDRMKACCFRKKHSMPRKHLLKNICGIAKNGELLAILGSSGAGKTTLLNSLAFRSPPGVKISSSAIRALNGVPVDAKAMRSRCAYVQQDDLFIGSLTAREHLKFQAILRMGKGVPYRAKLQRVDDVITELSLGKCADVIIGTPGVIKGLSGGERKRLAFASEALTDPSILLCDEPTSGLDSFMASNVLQVLKGLANKGKTIIITIHQPSSELFNLFDKLLLMAEGRVAFLGTPMQASDFFTNMGQPCPSNYNPADFFVLKLAIAPNAEAECRANIKTICDTFASSEIAKDVNEQIIIHRAESLYLHPLDVLSGSGYRASWFTQFWAILWRSWLSVLKEPMLVKVRLFQTSIIALIIGVIFYGQTLTQDGVQNINGAIFLYLTNMTFQNVFAVINVFCVELPVFMRESRSRLYRTDTYFLGKTLAELPLFIIVPFVFVAISYPLVGLQAGWMHFFNAFFIITLICNVATSFGYLISCASSSINMALSIGPPVIIPFLIFGGFFLNSGSVPDYFVWLSYLSWFRYGNEALLVNQWQDVPEGAIDCNRLNSTCPSSGKVILETLNFSADNWYLDIGALCALIFFFRFLAFNALYLRARSKE